MRIGLLLLGLGSMTGVAHAQIVGGGYSLVYAPAGSGVTASGSSGSVLAGVGLHDVLQFTPGTDASAESIHTLAVTNALLGDEDGDGDLFEEIGGGFDALEYFAYPDAAAPFPFGPVTIHDLMLSTRESFGGAGASSDAAPFGAADGSLFRFVPSTSGQRVRIVLAEADVLALLGQSAAMGDDVDVDDAAQDSSGNLYLTFADDEVVNGVAAGDGAVVFVPAAALTYSEEGDVTAVVAGAATVALHEAQVDALVASAGSALGAAAGDVHGLALDPQAGTFLGADGGTHPHLMFTTELHGPTVFTTANGGAFATMNLLPLGATTPDPSHFGMASLAGVGPIARTDARERALSATVADGEVDYAGGETLVQWASGNHAPHAPVLFCIGVRAGTPGATYPGVPLYEVAFPEFLAVPLHPNLVFPAVADAQGVLVFTGTLTHSISTHVLIAQVYDGTLFQLGPPAAMFFP